MFDPTYNQLVESGFEPARLLKENSSFPEYMGLRTKEIYIIAEHTGQGEYSIHRMTNPYGRHYEPVEIMSLDRFENINSLEELIKFLTEDKEPSTLSPPN